MLLRWLFLLVGVVLPGCSGTTRVVRLDTGRGSPIVHVPRSGQAAELNEDEVKQAVAQLTRPLRLSPRPQEAARRLFAVDPRSGSYFVDVRSRRTTPLTPGEYLDAELPQAEAELTRAYLRWCERTERRSDRLGLLKEGPTVTGDARFTLAPGPGEGLGEGRAMGGRQGHGPPGGHAAGSPVDGGHILGST